MRLVIHKKVFDKGDVTKYSKAIYTIRKRANNRFTLENSKGEELNKTYRSHELRRVVDIDEPEEIKEDNLELIEHKMTQKKRKRIRIYKKEGINRESVITKRLRR